jgi:hypothetical protein
MSSVYKFGIVDDSGEEIPYEYPKIWARQTTSKLDRVVVAPSSGQADVVYKLAEVLDEPFLLLYVLVVPRTDNEPGRYQSEYSFTLDQLREFLATYREFVENDARHNLWIRSSTSNGLLVYDRHNVIYAYGPLDDIISKITLLGFSQVEKISFPFPHTHHYHAEFDSTAERLFADEKWAAVSPLRTGDESPD